MNNKYLLVSSAIAFILMIGLGSALIEDNLIAYYNMSNTAGDMIDGFSGNHDGTINGAVTRGETGVIHNAYLIDANAEYVEVADHNSLDFTENMTVSFWVKMAVVDAQQYIIRKRDGGDWSWTFNPSATSLPEFILFESDDTSVTATGVRFNVGDWQHIVLTANSTDISIYSNGTLEDFTAYDGTIKVSGAPFWIGESSTNNEFHIDEVGLWNRSLTDDEIRQLYNGGAGNDYPFDEINDLDVTLVTPVNASFHQSADLLFNATLIPASLNITNATFYVWRNDGTVFNQTNVTVTGFVQNQTTLNINFDEMGEFHWNVFACGENSTFNAHCEWADSNGTFFAYNVTEEFDSVLIEGQDISLRMNITFENVDTDLLAELFWNSTEYATTKVVVGTDVVRFSSSFTIPVGYGNSSGVIIPHFWRYYLPSGLLEKNTSIENQTVYSIAMDNCSSFSNVLINYTLHDEETKALIDGALYNGTIEAEALLYNFDRSYLMANFSELRSNTNNLSICINDGILGNTTLLMDVVTSYVADDYVQEFHYIDNRTINDTAVPFLIPLYDILLGDSTTFLFTFFDGDGIKVPNALVHVDRFYVGDGDFREVEIGKLDNNGQTHIHLVEEDVIYRFRVTFNDILLYISGNYNAKCTTSPMCELELRQPNDIPDFPTDFDGLPIGTYRITSDKLTRQVVLTFNLNQTSTMNLTIYEKSLSISIGDTIVDSDTLTATSGSITLTVPITYGNETFYAVVLENDNFVGSKYIDLTEDAQTYFGILGFFLAGLMVLLLVMIGLSQGAFVIIWTVLGVVTVGLLKLVNLDWGAYIGITLVAGLLLYKLTRRKK